MEGAEQANADTSNMLQTEIVIARTRESKVLDMASIKDGDRAKPKGRRRKTRSPSPRKMNYPLLLKEIRRKRGLTKEQFYTLRKAIKAQCRTLMNVKRKPTEQETSRAKGLNPWTQRLPNMHCFFYTRNERLERKVNVEAAALAKDPNSLEQWLSKKMAKIPAHSHVTDVPLLEALARSLGNPLNLRCLLESILQDESLVKEIASRSYHQDLFDKLVIFSGTHWKLRMHIFESETFKEAQEEIHSHRDHFVSYCVYGGLSQQIWEEIHGTGGNEEDVGTDDDDDGTKGEIESASILPRYHKYAYDPTMDGDTRVFRIQHMGEVTLGPVDEEQKSSQGKTYYMHPSVLHSVEGIEGKTVTLVLNKRASEKSCFASPRKWEEQFVRKKISPVKLTSCLKEVLELMKTVQQTHAAEGKFTRKIANKDR